MSSKMSRRSFTKNMVMASMSAAIARMGIPAAMESMGVSSPALAMGEYFRGDFKVSMNLYCFNVDLNTWLKNKEKGQDVGFSVLNAIDFAAASGFDGVAVTMYYIPIASGRGFTYMPQPSDLAGIQAYIAQVKKAAADKGIVISGTGSQNDFTNPDPAVRASDMVRLKYWVDRAAEMGAPLFRVFAGDMWPANVGKWDQIVADWLVPGLNEIADYAKQYNIKIGVQNHGDVLCTAAQCNQVIKLVNNSNLGLVNDTGYFRPADQYSTPKTATTPSTQGNSMGYDWYSDIAAVFPVSYDIQLKRSPAGIETPEEAAVQMDLAKVFHSLRASPYREFLDMEVLYPAGDTEDHQTAVKTYLQQVRTALALTKNDAVTIGGTDQHFANAGFRAERLTTNTMRVAVPRRNIEPISFRLFDTHGHMLNEIEYSRIQGEKNQVDISLNDLASGTFILGCFSGQKLCARFSVTMP